MTPTSEPEPIVFGQRIQILRQRRGISRGVLAGLVDRSPSWVKQVETGRLGVPKLPMILRIAELLRVRNLADLTGDQSMSTDMFIGPWHARLPGVRDAGAIRVRVWTGGVGLTASQPVSVTTSSRRVGCSALWPGR